MPVNRIISVMKAMKNIEKDKTIKNHYLIGGMIFASRKEYEIVTVLGSCIAICLWDPFLKIGGMNHYLFPVWDGKGTPTSRYGDIAIPKLIKKMLTLGCKKDNLKAKIFGGASTPNGRNNKILNVAAANILFAEDLLKEEDLPIIGSDVGGNYGRKIKFNTRTGEVLLKRLHRQ
ncbi:MAG: chemotaxis protein CheD [Nitrospirota bacterium]